MFQLGIDVFLSSSELKERLKGQRLALLGHPASMTGQFIHTLDAIMADKDLNVTAAFGPQHGMRGEKQDNMQETETYLDPVHRIPVFSLYGEVRRPSKEMMETFDVLLVDLQDVGTRIYTYLTTLLYVMEEAERFGKSVWVLDRPNPAGRPIEGTFLRSGWVSFVGAAEGLPMRHGLTLGEAARWFQKTLKLNVDLKVITMNHYDPESAPGWGWPLGDLPWVNPSPNAATLSMARCFPGTVLLEGTTLSEGRGTTRPLELMGVPGVDMTRVLKEMERLAPEWMQGCLLRLCYFLPTFQKHAGQVLSGLQIHVDDNRYNHNLFSPYRLVSLWLKCLRNLQPEMSIWRDFHYEYEKERLAIDLINGGPELREWVDDFRATPADFEALCLVDESEWSESRKEILLY